MPELHLKEMWHFTLSHSIEIFFAIFFAVGAKWAQFFVEEDEWSESMEDALDYILICQGWIVCPLVFLACCLNSDHLSIDIIRSIASIIVIGMFVGLGFLVKWKTVEFFSKHFVVQCIFRYTPVVLLIGKIAVEAFR